MSHSIKLSSFFVLFVLSTLFWGGKSYANTDSLAGTQLAFFVGYHSGGMHNTNYYAPKYHYRGSYRSPWTYIGHNCRKTCWVDRWTGRSLSCYKTC